MKQFFHLCKFFFLFLLLLLAGCGPAPPLSKNGFLLDTSVIVTLYDSRDPLVLEGVFDLCAGYEQVFSRTRPGSELWELNHAGGEPVAVSPDLLAALEKAVHCARLTGGVYDVTVCPVVDLWDFAAEDPALPDPAAIQEALGRVDYRNIVIRRDTAQLKNGVQVDLGSVAKGYIADRMADFLREQGVGSALIDLGGNIVCVGGKPDGSPFQIGVQRPFEDRNETIGTLSVTDGSVVSSGVYERSFFLEERLYHHILDPRTGFPAETGVAGITVVTADSMDGDALSTCLFLLGIEEGLALAEEVGAEALFIDFAGNQFFTSGFRERYNYKES